MLSWAGAREKEQHGDPWSKRLGFRSLPTEGHFGPVIMAFWGYRPGVPGWEGKGKREEERYRR